MTTATIQANWVFFSKVCEFWFMNDNAAVPFTQCAVSAFAETLDAIGGDEVKVQFRTTEDPKEIAADVKKFSKRLAGVSPQWAVSAWEVEVIKGFPQTGYRICTLTRNAR